MRQVLFVLLVTFFSPLTVHSQRLAGPPIPYQDNGACPFECCVYREWSAKKVTVLRADRRNDSPVIFTVRKGDRVTAITGVVITTRPGRLKALRRTRVCPSPADCKHGVTVEAGDVLYLLTYRGEGYYTVWYKGRLFVDSYDENRNVQHLSEPEAT